ncbi:MAG: NADPH:quinone reductase [Firmicutes bacterium]|nr:NADPH:quinone reductase [Bacillota bacterium]
MKAIRVNTTGAPEVMHIEEIPDPVPEREQVLIKVYAAGVNPVETYIRAGGQGYSAAVPYTPGMDAAGVVESVGADVTKFKPGDRVYTAGTLTGSYAEKTLCLQSRVFHLPDQLTFSQGAALGVPYSTAYRALFHRAQARTGEFVMIHGASGGVGLAALQLAAAAGMKVIATAGTHRGKALVEKYGAALVIDHNDPDHFTQALEFTGGKGVDVILEMLANVNLGNDIQILAKHGRVVVIGSRGNVEITPRFLMGKDADIRGMTLMNVLPDEMDEIQQGIAEGVIKGSLSPVIGLELPLEKAPEAHHLVIEEKAYGKIILTT